MVVEGLVRRASIKRAGGGIGLVEGACRTNWPFGVQVLEVADIRPTLAGRPCP